MTPPPALSQVSYYRGMALWPGNRAPHFSTVTDEGKPLSQTDLVGQTTVLYFYPRADTAG